MAIVKRGRLNIAIYMSETNPKTKTNKVSNMELFVTSASVDAYNAAADDAARAATAMGELMVDIDNLTLGIMKEVQVGYAYEQNLAPPVPTTFALDKDKFLVSSRDTTNNHPVKISIPARNDAAIVIESDGITIDITAPDMSGFVTHYTAIALSNDLHAVAVLRAIISK
jgi:hypothetical protein